MSITFASRANDLNLISVYAPQSGLDIETKEAFYDELSDAISELKGAYFIGGDFNARIYHVRESERDVIGSCIIEKSRDSLTTMARQRRTITCSLDSVGRMASKQPTRCYE